MVKVRVKVRMGVVRVNVRMGVVVVRWLKWTSLRFKSVRKSRDEKGCSKKHFSAGLGILCLPTNPPSLTGGVRGRK